MGGGFDGRPLISLAATLAFEFGGRSISPLCVKIGRLRRVPRHKMPRWRLDCSRKLRVIAACQQIDRNILREKTN